MGRANRRKEQARKTRELEEQQRGKLEQIRKGYEAASANPGAATGLDGVLPCKKTHAALTVRLVSTNPNVRQVIAGNVTFAAAGAAVTKATTAAAAYLPLRAGATFTITGTVTAPAPVGFFNATVTGSVTVADLEHKFYDLSFTPFAPLTMYLDNDRDGVVDAQPSHNPAWLWGPAGPQVGGIIAVCNRWASYALAANVLERIEVAFRWDGGVVAPAGWAASIACTHPQMRIYDGPAKNAARLPPPLDFTAAPLVALRQADNSVHLWLQAADYPATAVENDWHAALTFTYTPPAGAQVVQTAVVRIAPWIMASDLDQTARVYSIAPAPAPAPVAVALGPPPTSIGAEISNISGAAGAAFTGFPLGGGGQNSKPFFRDVMKAGATDCPHYLGLVVLADIDAVPAQPVRSIQTNAVNVVGAGKRQVWAEQMDGSFTFNGAPPPGGTIPQSQDNGGNLLVSPPVRGYPLGRILYGQGTGAVAWKICNLRAFFQAQRVQAPIEIDSGWLNVGHVDEFISFVPNPADPHWPYKILLASPRLGYALAHAASALQNAVGVNVPQVIADAAALSEAARLAPDNFAAFAARLNGDPAVGAMAAAAGNPVESIARVAGYLADPPCPAAVDGRIVKWSDLATFQAHCIQNYFARTINLVGPGVVNFHEYSFNFVQPVIDATRQVLKQGLRRQAGVDLEDRFFVEIPVLLGGSGGTWVTDTPDAANLLLLNQPAGTQCIIPKPFGPVLAGHYVFEDYVRAKLAPLGLTLHFLNDMAAFHFHEGETHCGSNQLPVLPFFPARPHWWEQAPV